MSTNDAGHIGHNALINNVPEITTPLDTGRPNSSAGVASNNASSSLADNTGAANANPLAGNSAASNQVSFLDIVKSPLLAHAARAEQLSAVSTSQRGDGIDPETEKHGFTLETIHADSAEESRINQELADVMSHKLDASRRSVEKLLGLLQAVTTAEASYSRAMTAASNVCILTEGDGATLKPALASFSELLMVIGQAHKQVHDTLSRATRNVHAIVGQLRNSCQDIAHGSMRVHKSVEIAQDQLRQARVKYQEACSSGRRRSRFGSGGEVDPWACESRLVEQYSVLSQCAGSERQYLMDAFTIVKTVEQQRVDILKEGFDSFLHAYRNVVLPVNADLLSVQQQMDAINCNTDLADLADTVEVAGDVGSIVVGRQEKALEAAAQDLLCSPEIVRQGTMARWDSSSSQWHDCHFILTKSHCLHWLEQNNCLKSGCTIRLSRCQFEQGKAPIFNLVEKGGAVNILSFAGWPKKYSFKAATIEECCEWAIALREAIAAATAPSQ